MADVDLADIGRRFATLLRLGEAAGASRVAAEFFRGTTDSKLRADFAGEVWQGLTDIGAYADAVPFAVEWCRWPREIECFGEGWARSAGRRFVAFHAIDRGDHDSALDLLTDAAAFTWAGDPGDESRVARLDLLCGTVNKLIEYAALDGRLDLIRKAWEPLVQPLLDEPLFRYETTATLDEVRRIAVENAVTSDGPAIPMQLSQAGSGCRDAAVRADRGGVLRLGAFDHASGRVRGIWMYGPSTAELAPVTTDDAFHLAASPLEFLRLSNDFLRDAEAAARAGHWRPSHPLGHELRALRRQVDRLAGEVVATTVLPGLAVPNHGPAVGERPAFACL